MSKESHNMTSTKGRLMQLAEAPRASRRKSEKNKSMSKRSSSLREWMLKDPAYTPDIQHLVFPDRISNNIPSVGDKNLQVTNGRTNRGEQSNEYLSRSFDDCNDKKVNAAAGSTFSSTNNRLAQQTRPRSRDSLQQVADMNARGPNVSVLHLRSFDSPATYKKSTTASTNVLWKQNTLPHSDKVYYDNSRQLNFNYKKERYLTSENADDQSYGHQDAVGSCSRELSPVRWCDKEVDGVFLNKSGWVQVQQRSLDENRRSNYSVASVGTLPRRSNVKLNDIKYTSEDLSLKSSKLLEDRSSFYNVSSTSALPRTNTNTKLSNFSMNSEELLTKKLNKTRPLYLPIKKDFQSLSQDPSPHDYLIDSPPSITPIISPPPAFQDSKKTTSSRQKTFLPRCDAIDTDTFTPSTARNWKTSKTRSTIPSPSNQYRIPHTKSVEEAPVDRRSQFAQRYMNSSSSSSGSLGFRSLDSYVNRAMPRLVENTDSSIGYEDGEEDNNSSSLNISAMSSLTIQSSTESVNNSKTFTRSSRSRYNKRSPEAHESFPPSSPSSSSSSCERIQTKRHVQLRQPIRTNAESRIKRSRSLQLPEHSPNSRPPQVPHKVVVKLGNTEKTYKRDNRSSELDDVVLREAALVTEYLYGNKSKAAMIMQRYHQETKDARFTNVGRRNVLTRGATTPAISEYRSPCSSSTCDFWPHCAPLNSGNMRVSQSYPIHVHRSIEKADSVNKSSPASFEDIPGAGSNRSSFKDRNDTRKVISSKQNENKKNINNKSYVKNDTSIIRNVVDTRNYSDTKKQELNYVFNQKSDKSSVKNSKICEDNNKNKNYESYTPRDNNNLNDSNVFNDKVYKDNSTPNSKKQSTSCSSSSSDLWFTTSDKTASKSSRLLLKDSGDVSPVAAVITRPESAPAQIEPDRNIPTMKVKSRSLPKSFLSSQSGAAKLRSRLGTPSPSNGQPSRTDSTEISAATSVTPSRYMSASSRQRATSTPHLLDLGEPAEHEEISNESAIKPSVPDNVTDPRNVSESVLQKFRKTFSLRFNKKGENEQNSVPSSPPETLTSRRAEPQDHKYRFGPLVWRTSKERKKTKAQRSAKCNSGDSGIQIESNDLGSCTNGVDSCDEGAMENDISEERVRYSGESIPSTNQSNSNPRPASELSQSLFNRLKTELSKSPHYPNVRRAHSDLGGGVPGGGQRLLQWGANRKYPPRTSSTLRAQSSMRTSRKLRRSLSQPDIDKFSPIFSIKPMENHQLTDEERTSEDDCASDSGSSLGHIELTAHELNPLRQMRAHPIIPQVHSDTCDSHDSSCASPTCIDVNCGCHQDSSNSPACGIKLCGKSVSDVKCNIKYSEKQNSKICDIQSCDCNKGVWGEAVWDHIAMDPEELALTAGQSVLILDKHDNDWWWGQAEKRTGWFPAAFVRLLVSQEAPVVAPTRAPQLAPRHEAVRASVVLELIHTERDFVNLLTDVSEGYITECRRRPDMFSTEQINTVFSNLEDLLDFQRGFLLDLEQRINWETPHLSCVGDAFLIHKSGFRLYSDYCNAHPFATATLQALLSSRPHSHFLEACRLLRGLPELPLGGHLLAPVQRICKYPLQLAELLKYTPEEHDDYNNIHEALSCMRGVAVLINERKRRMESLEKIAAWQRRVEGWEGDDLIEHSSQLIHQGDAMRISTGMWSSSVTLFLFDHQLVYCKKDLLKRNTYIYKGRVCLDTTEIINVQDGKDTQLGTSVRHCIKLYSAGEDKWLAFCLRSVSSKAKWLSALEQERNQVASDSVQGLRITPQAKKLAAMANSKTITGTKNFSPNHYPSASLGRRVGTWFRKTKTSHSRANSASHSRTHSGSRGQAPNASHSHTHSS